jgi:hypothetical protein
VQDPLIAISGHPVSCEVDGEAVILSLKSGQYYGLSAVGARIWALIQHPRSFSDLHQALLQDLRDAGLVEIQP